MAGSDQTLLPDPQTLEKLSSLSATFGRTITTALGNAAIQGKSLDETLKSTLKSFEQMALKAAAQPLQQGLVNVFGALFKGLGSASSAGGGVSSALGALFGLSGGSASAAAPQIVPHALGGVLGGPSLFPMGDRLGLAGEAGPEAVLPLSRGPDGRLGVRAAAGRPVSVTVNVMTPDADSFRRSEAQVAGALARAVARGQRAT